MREYVAGCDGSVANESLYRGEGLDEGDLAATWLEQFRRWLDEAVEGEIAEPNAVDPRHGDAGRPHQCPHRAAQGGRRARLRRSTRTLQSRKASRGAGQPAGDARLPVDGDEPPGDRRRRTVTRVAEDEADAYFATRPRSAQLGAWASPQSTVIADRAPCSTTRSRRVTLRFPEDAPVPRPPHWGGLRVTPDDVEFWCGRRNRLHDRLRYHRDGDGGWTIERLAP